MGIPVCVGHHSSMEEKKLSCKECGKGYSSKRGLDRHVKIHNGKLHFCAICNKGFTDNFDLKRHTSTHKGPMENILSNLKYSCDLCEAVFENKRLLGIHKKSQHFEKEKLPPKKRMLKAHKKYEDLQMELESDLSNDNSMEPPETVIPQEPEPTFISFQEDIQSKKQVSPYKELSQHFDQLLWNYSCLTDIIEGSTEIADILSESIEESEKHSGEKCCCFLCSAIQSGCQLEIALHSF